MKILKIIRAQVFLIILLTNYILHFLTNLKLYKKKFIYKYITS